MDDLIDAAERVWATLDRADRLEAFAAHPRVTDRDDLARHRFPKLFTGDLPSTPTGSRDDVLDQLSRADREYEAKFDFRFIVARTDLPPSDVLALIRQRFHNDAEAEQRIAAMEQSEITRSRLRNLITRARS